MGLFWVGCAFLRGDAGSCGDLRVGALGLVSMGCSGLVVVGLLGSLGELVSLGFVSIWGSWPLEFRSPGVRHALVVRLLW